MGPWTISVCAECGCHDTVPGTGFCAECSGDEWTFLEAVPSTAHRGAVDALRELHAAGLELAPPEGPAQPVLFHVVKAEDYDRLWEFAFGDAPEWEKANATLKHRVRELEAENERLREALTREGA